MKLNKLLLFICLCSLTGVAAAQKTWEKPFEQWSKHDAIRTLSDSPWARTYQSESNSALAAQQQSAREPPQSKELALIFNSNFLSSQNPYTGLLPRRLEFKISKMIVGDNLSF